MHGMPWLPFAFCLATQEPTLPPLEVKVVNVVITSRKFDQTVKFYGETIGLRSFYQDQTSTFFSGGGVNVVIVRAKGKTKGSQVCLDLATPDVDKARKALLARGVKFEADTPKLVSFRDPDGNLIEVVRG